MTARKTSTLEICCATGCMMYVPYGGKPVARPRPAFCILPVFPLLHEASGKLVMSLPRREKRRR